MNIGNYLIALLAGGVNCIEQSVYTSFADLQKYGWTLFASAKVDPTTLGSSFAGLWKDWNLPNSSGDTLRVE